VAVSSKHDINKIAQINAIFCWPPNLMLEFQKEQEINYIVYSFRTAQRYRGKRKIFTGRRNENTAASAA